MGIILAHQSVSIIPFGYMSSILCAFGTMPGIGLARNVLPLGRFLEQ